MSIFAAIWSALCSLSPNGMGQ